MILCGLRPEIVMDISLRAVTFWNYQMAQEKIIQASNTKHLQEKLEQIKINTKVMERQFQKYILIEMKKVECKYTFKNKRKHNLFIYIYSCTV
jgi:E3 ubiquitin-protein ligase CCNP1IP1